MTRTISTSVDTLGYYVQLPEHIEEALSSHFENLTKTQQYTFLAALTGYMAEAQFCIVDTGDESSYSLADAYGDASGSLPQEIADLLEEIEDLERRCEGTILALTEALVLNIHYTHVEEE
jgi:hypothetical protein